MALFNTLTSPVFIKFLPKSHIPANSEQAKKLVGNILENVYYACSLLPKEQRYHNLTVCLRHENNLYIVSANNFNGTVKKKNGNYLSTHKGGSGIGLNSIATIAEKYNGMAPFSNTDKEFMIDVVLGQ